MSALSAIGRGSHLGMVWQQTSLLKNWAAPQQSSWGEARLRGNWCWDPSLCQPAGWSESSRGQTPPAHKTRRCCRLGVSLQTPAPSGEAAGPGGHPQWLLQPSSLWKRKNEPEVTPVCFLTTKRLILTWALRGRRSRWRRCWWAESVAPPRSPPASWPQSAAPGRSHSCTQPGWFLLAAFAPTYSSGRPKALKQWQLECGPPWSGSLLQPDARPCRWHLPAAGERQRFSKALDQWWPILVLQGNKTACFRCLFASTQSKHTKYKVTFIANSCTLSPAQTGWVWASTSPETHFTKTLITMKAIKVTSI